ncbi:MAG: plastocyanin/azurin family copper-binding protein [Dehalococcoidia bacterium]
MRATILLLMAVAAAVFSLSGSSAGPYYGQTCDGDPVTNNNTPTAGDDVLVGTSGADNINGGGGRDKICGGPGADLLSGGAGADELFGEGGNDRLFGGGAVDTLSGGPGTKDRCDGGAGLETSLNCEIFTNLTVKTAPGLEFAPTTFTVPRSKQINVTLNNLGGTHNIDFYQGTDSSGVFVAGTDLANGPNIDDVTFTTPSEPGSYYYECALHGSGMSGTWVVQ